jgi:hypothetical protein
MARRRHGTRFIRADGSSPTPMVRLSWAAWVLGFVSRLCTNGFNERSSARSGEVIVRFHRPLIHDLRAVMRLRA